MDEKKLPQLKRSIRILLTWELDGTLAWAATHRRTVRSTIAGLNLDSVGGDQSKVLASLKLRGLPAATPSCTEALLEHLMERISPRLRWESAPFAGGDAIISDPAIGIPAPAVWLVPEKFNHTNEDTPDKLCALTFQEMGKVGATYLYFLAMAGCDEASWLAHEVCSRGKAERVRSSQTRHWAQRIRSTLSLSRDPALKRLVAELEKQLRMPSVRKQVSRSRGGLQNLIPARRSIWAPNNRSVRNMLSTTAEIREYRRLIQESDIPVRNALYWCDGKRSIAQVLDEVEVETGKPLRDPNALEYFKFLEKAGLLKLRPAKGMQRSK
jgi:hypothetical protein